MSILLRLCQPRAGTGKGLRLVSTILGCSRYQQVPSVGSFQHGKRFYARESWDTKGKTFRKVVSKSAVDLNILPTKNVRRSEDSPPNPIDPTFNVSKEVQEAISRNKPVVALETTIYTHGFPYPENVDLALKLEDVVRQNGAIPATIGIVDGVAHVGLSKAQLIALASSAGDPNTMKVSRRDLPYILGMGLTGRKLNGGTTISGTMILANKAGIKVFGTGGLGGVHRGGQDTMDISADLTELGRTPVAVISSGCKSFLDLPRTLEFLETQGATVCTYADGRSGDINMPAFYTRDSGIKSPMVFQTPREAAAMIFSQDNHNAKGCSGFLFANPIPEAFSIPKAEIDVAIDQAVTEAAEKGFHGHSNTPFILSRIKDLTKGNSIPANTALIESNVALAAKIAVELSQMRAESSSGAPVSRFSGASANRENLVENSLPERIATTAARPDIIVFGSVAVDVSCDYTPNGENGKPLVNGTDIMPQMHTSNIASISTSLGGVGHNVALAAQRAGPGLSVLLRSLIGNDRTGDFVLSALKKEGLDYNGIVRVGTGKDDAKLPTAQYVSVNDAKKDLVLAMADMSIFSQSKSKPLVGTYVNPNLSWCVVDANWAPEITWFVLNGIKDKKLKAAFEPVSAPKAAAVFRPLPDRPMHTWLFPNHKIDLATPNQHELAAMFGAAKESELFETQSWWQAIDALGISSAGARDRFVTLTNAKMTDEGIPHMTVQMLPLIPTILTKLGSEGVLLTELLKPDDPRLTDPEHAPWILSRCSNGSQEVGGVYMRLFPAVEKVEDVVSVNGVGDTFLGVLIAGLARGVPLSKDLIDLAQRGAVMTLRSKEAVSPDLSRLGSELAQLDPFRN